MELCKEKWKTMKNIEKTIWKLNDYKKELKI
jgi:hypothetical protein